jgi:hypothetical protein
VTLPRQFLCLATLLLASTPVLAAVPEKVRFNQHVRPILSGNCFYCHGPDPKHREADLRLDLREGATADLGGYAAIVPGKPDESMLIKRVSSTDPDEHMPPPASKKPHLTAEQIAILRRWIEQGAEYEGHWAFLPLQNAQPPAVKNEAWVRNPIDRFILARLEQERIAPSPDADPATLIRRVTLDLTGLLPSPEEVESFVRAWSPTPPLSPSPTLKSEGARGRGGEGEKAYEALVERLLASPHYGERWGRHWLDQARYADSNGYSIDSERQMWPYRDWVIKAISDDMPFDQFTLEQLAGDLLPSATKSQMVATAFHRNTLINEEGGTDKEQFRHEAVVDRVNTTGAVWLGLTVACCQCHTHKFDPIPHREYYQLFAFFNNGTDVNNKGATLSVAKGELLDPTSGAVGNALSGAVGNALRGVPEAPATPNPDRLAARRKAWEKLELARLEKLAAGGAPAASWSPAKYVEYDTKSNSGFQLQDDNSLLSDGRGADNDTYRIVARSALREIAAIRLRTLTHPSLPRNGPGMAGNGNFVLTQITVSAGGQERPIASAWADHEQPEYAVAGAIDDDPKTGWAINVGPESKVRMNAPHEAVFVLKDPVPLSGDQALEIKLLHELNENYLIGRFAIDFAETAPAQQSAANDALLAALRIAADQRTSEQKKVVDEAYAKTNAPTTASSAAAPAAAVKAEVMVWKELEEPRETYIALRGDFLRPDKEVGPLIPDVPSAVPPKLPSAQSRNRIDLARWLVDPQNPLTPRVTMNRVWMRYFGRGLVETEEDFGTQGTLPTHPELLDWLAGELHRQRWSLKAMHKLIVTSSTYRQASRFRPDLKDKDPRNLLLARQERLRFDAEIVRDAALTASGLLDRTIGGPSVRPPQPDGVYAFTQTAKKWTADTGPARYRRAMYTTYFRSAPHPLFTTFDAPDFQTVCTRRGRSNTPLQALTVANDVAFLEFAQALAARASREAPAGDIDARLRRAFMLALCREPSPAELSILRGYYDRQATDLAKDDERAKGLLSPELAKSDRLSESAAMVLVCRAILNTDGFITRE